MNKFAIAKNKYFQGRFSNISIKVSHCQSIWSLWLTPNLKTIMYVSIKIQVQSFFTPLDLSSDQHLHVFCYVTE